MDKDIGFNRNIKLDWLNATASYRAELDDPSEIRKRLEVVLAQDRSGAEAIRKSIDILINIWYKNGEQYPELHEFALKHFQNTFYPADRLWPAQSKGPYWIPDSLSRLLSGKFSLDLFAIPGHARGPILLTVEQKRYAGNAGQRRGL